MLPTDEVMIALQEVQLQQLVDKWRELGVSYKLAASVLEYGIIYHALHRCIASPPSNYPRHLDLAKEILGVLQALLFSAVSILVVATEAEVFELESGYNATPCQFLVSSCGFHIFLLLHQLRPCYFNAFDLLQILSVVSLHCLVFTEPRLISFAILAISLLQPVALVARLQELLFLLGCSDPNRPKSFALYRMICSVHGLVKLWKQAAVLWLVIHMLTFCSGSLRGEISEEAFAFCSNLTWLSEQAQSNLKLSESYFTLVNSTFTKV